MNNHLIKRSIFLFISIIAIILIAKNILFTSNKGIIYFTKINNDTTIKIPLKMFSSPFGVELKISGYVEDTCSFGDLLVLPKGMVDTTFKYDYYNPKEFVLTYYSKKSKKSSLKIEYYIP